ncbi:MAG: choice-of-anchor D domain-containing protein [Deltaproteobacteria bacterium]|nr:choice-of-anchor D domain-containing protein [Deltaproteobacteria bacterium]
MSFRHAAAFGFALTSSLMGCDCGEEELQKSYSEMAVEPLLVDFGDVLVGEFRAKALVVGNRGNAPLNIQRFDLTGSAELALAGPVPPIVLGSGSVQVALAYQPVDEGLDEAELVVESDDGRGPIEVTLRGRGVRPGLTVEGDTPGCGGSSPSVAFGSVQVGSTSERRVRLRASGSAPIEITGATPVGSAAFTADLLVASVSPNESVELVIHFRPIVAGTDSAEIHVATNSGTIVVPVCGRGAGPALCAHPSPLDLGSTGPGVAITSTLTLESCGDLPLELTLVEVSSEALHPSDPGFSILPIGSRTLAPGDSVELPVTLRSSSLGRKEGFIHASSSALGAPDGYFALVGRVAPPCDLIVAPDRLTFPGTPAGQSSTKSVLVANQGSESCQITSVAVSGAPSFSLPSPVGPFALASGDARTLSVTFAPTSTAAATEQGTLIIEDLGGPHPVDLLGNTTEPSGCALDLDPTVVSFGPHAIGSTDRRTVRLRNFGEVTCRISGVRLANGSPSFSAQGPTLPFVLPGLRGSIDVDFQPTQAGPHYDTLLISVTAGGNTETLSVALSGVGADARLCVSPPELDFGVIAVGQSAELPFSIESCGSVAVDLRGLVLSPTSRRNFSIVSGPVVPTRLPAGASEIVRVRYTPLSPGPHFGVVDVLSSDLSQPSVRLTGGTVPDCDKILDCAPATIEFGPTAVATSKPIRVVCVNAGVAAVDLSNVAISGADLSVRAEPGLVRPGETVVIEVVYSPTTSDPTVGSLTLTSDACLGPTTLPISGEGFTRQLPLCLPPQTFSPVVDWAWSTSTFEPAFKNVWMTPLVANLTDDNLDGRIDENDFPEVIFTTFDRLDLLDPTASIPGILRIVSGQDGTELVSVDEPRFAESAQLAVGDLDGDGVPEIIGSKWRQTPSASQSGLFGLYTTGTLVALDPRGRVLWESEPFSWPNEILWNASAPSLADLDGDGFGEIVLGREVFDHQGRIVWRGDRSLGATGGGPHSIVADLDLDGRPEVIAGDTAYRADGTVLWQAMDRGRALGEGGSSVGWLDPMDTHPSVLLDTGNTLHAIDHLGSVSWSVSPPSRGPTATLPVLADFDGDGADEVAVADGLFVRVYDGDGTELWSSAASDSTCCPGISAFDFEGDGAFELLLNDFGQVYVFRGATGQVIYLAPRPSRTNYEVPVVADVDLDGHAEIIVANDGGPGGITVYSNTGDNWVAAPPIWNQQSFHVGNVHASGAIPRQSPRLVGAGTVFRGTQPACLRP